MKPIATIVLSILFAFQVSMSMGQSPSFETFVNPVIPGDHPDPTLTKVGNHFYTSGSSFNPTPKIYRSTDLVHWEVIAQPVSPTWSTYGNEPGGGIWGGHTVFNHDTWWHYFGRGGGSMYFVTAEQPEGPWSEPKRVTVPSDVASLGVDNSIFIDDDGSWYLLIKHGRENNHILELGSDGQPTGNILDLTWLNPDAEDNPYGWAEGPVMWKRNGWYYYSFAQHLAGSQYVMKSDTLSDDPSHWAVKNDPMQHGSPDNFNTPNHISPAVMLDDSTSWIIGHSYHRNWITQGRQGLLLEIEYDEEGFPEFQYPQDEAAYAPDLPSSGIPWMVPKSDLFDNDQLNPEWSFLGTTPNRYVSLTERPGWLRLDPGRRSTTLIKNDGEHQYSLITRLDFDATESFHQAGLWIFNGPQNLQVKLISTVDDEGKNIFAFSFNGREFTEPNMVGNIAWLKLERDEHDMRGYFSDDGADWVQIGNRIDASELNVEQTDFNSFTGNQQGLFAQGEKAFFDLYIYRDAYSDIAAQHPVNHSGIDKDNSFLGSIHSGDWALYAGVEFGLDIEWENGFNYPRTPDSVFVEASATTGGLIEIWADSINTGTKISEIAIEPTEGPTDYQTFNAAVDSVGGQRDIYLKFTGEDSEELFRLRDFRFTPKRVPLATSIQPEENADAILSYKLQQNYPNPFNPSTKIGFQLPTNSEVSLKVFDMLGREVATLVNERISAGEHQVSFNASDLSSGMYIYQIKAGEFQQTRKMLLLK